MGAQNPHFSAAKLASTYFGLDSIPSHQILNRTDRFDHWFWFIAFCQAAKVVPFGGVERTLSLLPLMDNGHSFSCEDLGKRTFPVIRHISFEEFQDPVTEHFCSHNVVIETLFVHK